MARVRNRSRESSKRVNRSRNRSRNVNRLKNHSKRMNKSKRMNRSRRVNTKNRKRGRVKGNKTTMYGGMKKIFGRNKSSSQSNQRMGNVIASPSDDLEDASIPKTGFENQIRAMSGRLRELEGKLQACNEKLKLAALSDLET